MEILSDPDAYKRLSKLAKKLCDGLVETAENLDIPLSADFEGGMFGFAFSPKRPSSFKEALSLDLNRFRKFYHEMLDRGVYFAPSAFEAGFVSLAHTEEMIDTTLEASENALKSL